MKDIIYIKDLRVKTIIGIFDWERKKFCSFADLWGARSMSGFVFCFPSRVERRFGLHEFFCGKHVSSLCMDTARNLGIFCAADFWILFNCH